LSEQILIEITGEPMTKSGFRASSVVWASLLLASLSGTQGFAQPARPTLRWKFATNDWVISLAVGSNAIYAGTWTGGMIYVLAPDGVQRRQISVGRSPTYGVYELAVADDGTIYAGSADENLYALDPEGALKWKNKLSGRTFEVGRDGAVYADSFAFDPKSGQPKTRFPGFLIALGDDNTVYIQDQGICAFDRDGKLKWESPARFAPPIVVGNDGTIYFG
jgi:outer membrane protein assembly factor BamB